MKTNDVSPDVFCTNKHKRLQYVRWATLESWIIGSSSSSRAGSRFRGTKVTYVVEGVHRPCGLEGIWSFVSGNDDAVVRTILGIFKWDFLHLIQNSNYYLYDQTYIDLCERRPKNHHFVSSNDGWGVICSVLLHYCWFMMHVNTHTYTGFLFDQNLQ